MSKSTCEASLNSLLSYYCMFILDRIMLHHTSKHRVLYILISFLLFMGWQKTFTLSRRSKGCHLVTNEILSQIQEGLKDVQVSASSLEIIASWVYAGEHRLECFSSLCRYLLQLWNRTFLSFLLTQSTHLSGFDNQRKFWFRYDLSNLPPEVNAGPSECSYQLRCKKR